MQPPRAPSAPWFSPKLKPRGAGGLSEAPGGSRAALAWREQQLLRGPDKDANRKTGNSTAMPIPLHPGNVEKDHGTNASRQRAVGNGECWGMLMLQPNRAGPPRTSSILQPSPPARSQLQESQCSNPIPGEGFNHRRATTRAPTPRTSKRLVPLRLPARPLVPVRAPALKPGGLFLTRATQRGKKIPSPLCTWGDLAGERRGGITG